MAGESIGQPRKIDENRIMSKAEYEADATRRIKEAKKRGIQISPGSYSRYFARIRRHIWFSACPTFRFYT